MRRFFFTQDEITSTAKLLEVIRGEDTTAPYPSADSALASLPRGRLVHEFLQRLPLLRRRLVVGIDIGPNCLTLVRMLPFSPAQHQLLDLQLIPFPPMTSKGSPAFCEFLRSVVADFCGSLKRVGLWSSLSPAYGDLRQIRIPRKAVKGDLTHAVYWVARKELKFDEAETLFDFEVQAKVAEERDGKIWIMAYTAPREAVKEVRALFAKSGLELEGLTIAPFVVQNLFRSQWVSTSGAAAYADLQLGETASRISIFFKNNLILSKLIDTGTTHLASSIAPGPTSEETPREEVSPALAKLTGEIEAVFQYHRGPGKGEPVPKLFLSGAATPGKDFIGYVSQQLGVRIEAIDLLKSAIPFLPKTKPPPSLAERALFTSSLGLALSSNSHTPNLLCPFVQKTRQAALARLNHWLLSALVIVAVLLGSLLLWLDHARNQKSAELTRLRQELAQLTPFPDGVPFTDLASRIKDRQQQFKGKAEKYLSLAALSELSALTPDSIRLLNITADFGGLPETETRELSVGQIKSVSRSLVIEGIVEGDSLSAETSLAHYLIRLGASPLFIDPAVHQSALEITQELGEVLHFILRMGLGQGG